MLEHRRRPRPRSSSPSPSVGAKLNIGGLEIGGEARNFAFIGDGTFARKHGFGVFLARRRGDRRQLQVAVLAAGPDQRDRHPVGRHPATIPRTSCSSLSASVTGIPGIAGLEFSGSIEGIKIDRRCSPQGEFPIIDIASLGVTVKGNLFGGELDAALIGGILKLDASGHSSAPSTRTRRSPTASSTSASRAASTFAGMGGFTIRLGLSELGPLRSSSRRASRPASCSTRTPA